MEMHIKRVMQQVGRNVENRLRGIQSCIPSRATARCLPVINRHKFP